MLKDRFANGGRCPFNMTKNLANGSTSSGSSTISAHLREHLHVAHHLRCQGFTASHVRPLVFVDSVWVGNVLSCMKPFQTQHCQLCMKERYYLFHHRKRNPTSIMNENLGIYSGCPHKPKFHRFLLRSDNDEDDP